MINKSCLRGSVINDYQMNNNRERNQKYTYELKRRRETDRDI